MKAEAFLIQKPIFSTREFATATGYRTDAASRKLNSWKNQGLIKQLTRGVWVNLNNKTFSVYGLTPYVVGLEQGYVSFLSALHRHGVISQIPQKVFVASTGHGRKVESELATFEIIQMKAQYMQSGIEWFSGAVSYGLASPEKALLDCLYLSTRRGKKFRYFPELDLSKIKQSRLKRLIKEHRFPNSIEAHILGRVGEFGWQ